MTRNIYPTIHKFSASDVAACKCNDCGTNVIKDGSYCMLHPRIWEKKFGLGWNDNLCLACIEARLGRKLSMARLDFISPPPQIEGYPTSDALWERYGFNIDEAKKTPPAKAKRGKS
jgi:hypothetical protein